MTTATRILAAAIMLSLAACGRGGGGGGQPDAQTRPGASKTPSQDAEMPRPPAPAQAVETVRLRPAMMSAARKLSDMPPSERALVIEQIKCMGREAVAEGRTPEPRTSAVVAQAAARATDAGRRSACHEMLAKPVEAAVPAAGN